MATEKEGWEDSLVVELQKAFIERFGGYSDYDVNTFYKRLSPLLKTKIERAEKSAVDRYDLLIRGRISLLEMQIEILKGK